MLKRINYTDRRRIPRNQIAVKVDPVDPASFTIDLPKGLLTDPDLQVAYVDITSAGSSEVLRHKLACHDGRLDRGPYPLGRVPWRKAIFDVKVVATAGEDPGRILRRAARIKAVGAGVDPDASTAHQLLSTIREPLGEQVWALRLGDPVTLVINSALTMPDDEFLGNQSFASLVFPEICRRSLDWAVASEGVMPGDLTADDMSAAALWVRFAVDIAPQAECPLAPVGGWAPHNRGELDDWIAEVVDSLCRRHRLCSTLAAVGPETFS